MGRIRDLQRALELAHYAARNRGALHVAVLGGTVSVAELQLDLRLLGAYGMRSVVVGRWQGSGARDLVALARRQGFPLELVDGDDETVYVLRAVVRALDAKRVPIVLVPERALGPRSPSAETLGREIAVSLGARRLLLVTSDAGAILGEENRPQLTRDEAEALATRAQPNHRSTWSFILGVLDAGISGVVVLEGAPGVVFEELFTHCGAGVLIGGEHSEEVRKATLADAADISLLLRAEIERGVVRPFSEDQLLATVDQHLVYAIDGIVIGTARLAPHGAWAELSRFATLPRYRGRGRARQLGLALIEWGAEAGFSDLFALSIDDRMWRFFESLGFEPIVRESLPESWRTGYDFSRPSRAFHRRLASRGEGS